MDGKDNTSSSFRFIRTTELRKALQHAGILCYLLITLGGFIYTMTRVRLPFLPWPLVRMSYGMMAPYQTQNVTNFDILAEGRRDGTGTEWEKIDLDPYYPMILGNRVMYRSMLTFLVQGEKVHHEKYRELAQKLLERERWKGNRYEAVRLTWEEWPVAPASYVALRREPYIHRRFLTQVP